MDWLSQNWVWILFAVGMIAMHMFGHSGHGGHGGHGGHCGGDRDDTKPAGGSGDERVSKPGPGHQH